MAKPYYYKVYLAEYDVVAEFTPTDRSVLFRFTFPENDNSHVVIDVETTYKGLIHGTENVHPAVSSTGRLGHEYYNKLGYVSYDVRVNESAARTLE